MTDNSERIVLNDRYEIQQRIGRGGMADVFLARDVLLDRPVAIKVLFPEFATDPNFVERFRREAQAAANLNHPNIVSVYDWGKYSNTYFMAMEYVQGRTLADILRANGHVSSVQAAEIASEVSAALGFAHKNGVVHRDIKPANILIGSGGQVKVADFGIARAMNAPTESNLTQVGSVMGTATYFSPEQAQGANPDPRSDLYSLGIVLYEMVAGRPPFTGDNPVGIAYKQVHDAPQPLNQLVADVPRPFEAIVAKLLAKKPEQRYADADALRDDLRRFRSGEPVHALGGATGPAAPAGPVVITPASTTNLPRTQATQAAAAYTAAATTAMPRTTAMPTANPYAPSTGPVGTIVYEEPPNRNGLYAVLGFLAVIALVVGGLVLFNVLKKDDTDGAAAATTTSTALIGIPNVVGMTFDVASTTISELGLEPELVPQENPDVPESQVFSTSPLANTLVEAGSIVQIFYRPSKDPQPVPDLTGKNVEEAKRILTEQGFVAGTTTTETSDLTPDTVIRTDPAANTVVKAGSTVNIVLSAGPATVPVPPVTLQAVDVAKAFLEADPRNFVVTVVEQPDPEIPAGTVISQDPAAGSDLAPGAAITLVVSSGPQKVPVPPVVGLKEGEARNSITGVGLVATVQYQSLPSGDVNDGLVIAQTPSAGVDVDPGATVNLKVGKAVAPPSTTTSTTTTTLPPTTTTSTTTTTTVAPTIAPTAPPGP